MLEDVKDMEKDCIEALKKAEERLGNTREIFIVTLSHDNVVNGYYSGKWFSLAIAANVLSNEFNRHINGDYNQ